ncbi:SDR family oxidoreductase [Rhodococcus sp. P1Y]|uniref:SDR family oxidoreductase n=1 Tax=Rhodococcus sp. P1Y TaxID=1302308 RepID=UPI000EAD9387|nr:SDR family oxidoreductase [Rhodococcus sp. P1Y]AYJ48295.1 SDR family oxidoreductase [Rhodococcus sp. P1Y]
MSFEIDLTGRIVVVTGGGRGVGAGIVDVFVEAGAYVEMCGRSASSSDTERHAGRTTMSRVDVRDADAVEQWIDGIAERHGRIDVVVNNAGGAPFAQFNDSSSRFFDKVLALNFTSAVYVCRSAAKILAATPDSSVVNITSISARRPSPGTAVYGAAKAALESLTQSLAVEWAPDVRVNAVSCGLVATPGSVEHYGDAEQYAKVAATIPRGQLATPQEIGQACLMLASPLASHITGAVLNVDGGGEWPAFLQHTPNA